MPGNDLLTSLWEAVERAGEMEQRLRALSDELAGWRAVTAAAVRALDREFARRREEDATRTTVG